MQIKSQKPRDRDQDKKVSAGQFTAKQGPKLFNFTFFNKFYILSVFFLTPGSWLLIRNHLCVIMGQWSDYFVTTAGGAAALAGLIFVSVSLNLKKILSLKHLPGRALGSLILLTNILLIGSFCLVPGQSVFWLGCEISSLALVVWVANTRMDIKMYRGVERHYQPHYLQNLFFSQVAILPFAAAGIFLLNNSQTGFYFLIPGITFSFIKALVDSWVLLVEINR